MNDAVAGGDIRLGNSRAVHHYAAAGASDIERSTLNRGDGRGSHRRNIGAADFATDQMILKYLRQLRRVLQQCI